MKRSLRRTTGLATLALTATLGFAACGDDERSSDETTTKSSVSEQMRLSAAAAQTFGAGCSAIPSEGAGSFDAMATEPVATAASGNPLLSTLVAALGEAELAEALDAADAITVFAPTDEAFAAIPEQDLDALLADTGALTQVLAYHVVPGRIAPEELAGTHRTLVEEDLVVEGSGDAFTVGEGQATVLCGNVPTANATVYVIDGVLMP